MDPVTIFVVLFVASEILDGGAVTASAAGAIGAGAKAAAAETAKGAKGWYKKRAKGMKKTGWGRARLRAEAATAGAVAFLGRGVKAGAKAAPGGAKSGWAKGRQVRDGAVTVARQRLADGTAKVRARGTSDGADSAAAPAPVEPQGGGIPVTPQAGDYVGPGGRLNRPLGPHPLICQAGGRPAHELGSDPTCSTCRAHAQAGQGLPGGEQGAWRKPGDGTADPRVEITGETVHADDFTYTTDTELRQLAAGGNQAAARELMRRASSKNEKDQQSPASGGGENKGENVSDTASFPAEKVGAAQYVPAWDTPGPTLELTMSSLASLVDEMSASAEANTAHEVGGVQDVIGKGAAAVEAIQAFGEAIAGHASALHDAHDKSIEAGSGSDVESITEYVGAH